MNTQEPNYLGHAFKSQYNLIGLGTAVGFAILSVSFLPLLIAAGVQMAVLPLVAGSERFQRYVKAKEAEEERQRREAAKQLEISEMLYYMPEDERRAYRELHNLAGEIRQNYKGLDSSSRMLLDDLVRKLDFLLGFYVRMRYSLTRYQAYFNTTDPDRIQERIEDIDREVAAGPERIRAIKGKTRAVLLKRLERYRKASENRQLIEAQTETVKEVLQLLRDQSYSIRDPRSIAEQLDGLVASAEETERGVKDLDDLLRAEEDLLLPAGAGEDIEAELEAGRQAAAVAPPPVRPPVATTSSPPPPPRKKITH